jgi:hypothetical protein
MAHMFQMLAIPHRFKKIGLHNLVFRRIFSNILLVLGLKKVEKHFPKGSKKSSRNVLGFHNKIFSPKDNIAPILQSIVHFEGENL